MDDKDSKRKLNTFEPKVRYDHESRSVYFSGLTVEQAEQLINFAARVLSICSNSKGVIAETNVSCEPWIHSEKDKKFIGTPICEPITYELKDANKNNPSLYDLIKENNKMVINTAFTPINQDFIDALTKDDDYFKGKIDDAKICSFEGTAQSISITPDKPSIWHKIKRVLRIIASIRLRYDYENYRINHSSIGLTWNKDPYCDDD